MTRLETQAAALVPQRWISILEIAFGGGAFLGGTLLIVAAVKASLYQGFGESGVYELLFWGFPVFGISLAGLLVLVVWRAIRTLIGMRRIGHG